MDGRLLVVEDDPQVRAMLARALGYEGFEVTCVADAAGAMTGLRSAAPELMLLDLLLPDEDGIEVCRQLRRQGHKTPILLLTARDAVEDRVKGLDSGADDYLVKPFSLEELLARVRALLRRTEPVSRNRLSFSDLTVDLDSHEVRRGDRLIDLTSTEFDLLVTFARHPRQVLSRETLLDTVWGMDMTTDSHVVEVYVGYLRQKLEAGGEPRLIATVRGAGYVLRETPA
jgi:two-component system response regulator MprA